MENHIPQQLSALGISVALGAAGALVYDLLRALRGLDSRDNRLTHLLDGVFVAAAGAGLLYLAVRLGGGELRLFMLAGLALGALAWFLLFSRWLRPVWEFWAAALSALGALAYRPVVWFARQMKALALRGRMSRRIFTNEENRGKGNGLQSGCCPEGQEGDRRRREPPAR